MMHVHLGASAHELWQQGRITEAIARLSTALRVEPGDRAARMFLFELLLIEGEWERAARQLALLRGESSVAALAMLPLAQALDAEAARTAWYHENSVSYDAATQQSVAATLNGQSFAALTDSDPLVGAQLELFHAGQYLRVPFADVASLRMEAPTQLWQTIWAPAVVRLATDSEHASMGRVLLPTRTWLSHRDADPQVRQGRATIWRDDVGGARPFGQKVLLTESHDFSLLDIRSLDVAHTRAQVQALAP
jgi:type VI secretion system protein ImpE